jgi:hypothetical protein
LKLLNTLARVGMLTAFALITGSSVSAQTLPLLDMSVLPTPQTAAPGDAPFWNVHLTNNNTETAYFVIVGFYDGLAITPDVSVPFYDPLPFGVPYTLAPNASLDLNGFFQTDVSPSAADATYDSLAELNYDLYESDNFSNLLVSGATASGDWRLIVQAPTGTVPEPGSVALLLGLTWAGSVSLLRRRKR